MVSNKILVTYASRAGSTAGIAEAIGKTLVEGGAQVDVLPLKDVQDLASYLAVVAGSAIRGGKWLPEALRFIQAHQAVLSEKPFAAFMVCITLGMANVDKYRPGLAAWMEPVRALVKPVSEGYFAGLLDFSKVPFTFSTLLLRATVLFGVFPKGDHRDWNAVRSWAESILPLLQK